MKVLSALIFFWALSLVFYFKTAGAGFCADSVGWIQVYEQTGWRGIFSAFDDKAIHYVYHVLFFSLWKVLGLNGYAWTFVLTALHAGVATLSFNIFETLFSKTKIGSATTIAFAGAFLFVISPYLTETVVWYACVHYLVCVLLLLSAFRLMLKYQQLRQKKSILLFYVSYITALFSLELSFVFPVILLLFILFWPLNLKEGADRKQLLKIFVAPSFLLIGFYFLLSSVLRGSVVGHYGAQAHFNMHVPLLMANLSKYMSKIFFFSQFFDHKYSDLLYALFEKALWGWALSLVLASGAVGFLLLRTKIPASYSMVLLLFAFFILALLPILNLYVTCIVNVESDRFTYFASVFAYPFLVLLCISVFRKYGWLIVVVFTFFQIKFLQFNTENWKNSHIINHALTSSFKWQNAEKIFVLNLPDNFKGAYLFRGFPPENSFWVTSWLINDGHFKPQITDILLYNMNDLSDGVQVEKISDNELNVVFNQWGNWWWRFGVGATDYSTNEYQVKIDEWGHSYRVVFLKKEPGTVYLYQSGGEWKEVVGF